MKEEIGYPVYQLVKRVSLLQLKKRFPTMKFLPPVRYKEGKKKRLRRLVERIFKHEQKTQKSKG